MLAVLFLFFLIDISKQYTPILTGEWAYSDAISKNDEIIFCYKKRYIDDEEEKGGIARYKNDLTLISDSDMDDFHDIYNRIKIYNLNTNSFVMNYNSEILVIKDYSIIYTITQSTLRDIAIVSDSKFLALSTSGLNKIYRLYDINVETDFDEDSPTYKTFISTKEYEYYKCEKFLLSDNNYIFCLMTFKSLEEIYSTYYVIFDDNLNLIVAESELTDDPLPQTKNQFILMVQFTDTIIVALLVKIYDECLPLFHCNSYLIAFEMINNDGAINVIKKKDINLEIYIGKQQIYLEKLSNEKIAMVYPEDQDLMVFNIKIISYIDNTFNEIKTFQIESNNDFGINSLRIFSINSEIAITYSQENWEEDDEDGFTYFFYLTIPK